MPHWRRANHWACVDGTPGHATPLPLRPLDTEPVVHKAFYSAFEGGVLERSLRNLGVDTLCVAGVHLHACIRTTAIDAYQRGFEVWIAEDAVGSYDELHAELTRSYLTDRIAEFHPVEALLTHVLPGCAEDNGSASRLPAAIVAGELRDDAGASELLHRSPRLRTERLWRVPIARAEMLADATRTASRAAREWGESSMSARVAIVERLIALLEARTEDLARQLAIEVGQPLREGRAEIDFARNLLRAAACRAAEPREVECGDGFEVRRRPLGAVALVTPWNNPLGIPLGKLAPAILYGNAAVWKPSPPGSAIALEAHRLLLRAGCPPGLVSLICGDRTTAERLMSDFAIDAVSLTGSSIAGRCAQAICARRRIPLQAELGGNNAAIVWGDADLERAATEIGTAAFGSAGQSCRANRRVIVADACFGAFLEALREVVATLRWGDPLDPECQVGPLISDAARERVARSVARAEQRGAVCFAPQAGSALAAELEGAGAYYPPTIVCPEHESDEIVQQETFGPVLVVQRAGDWLEALRLLSGVPQGLVSALFSASPELRASFLEHARAGVLKFDSATAGLGAQAPFGGWKASGVGPPEHGSGDPEFYTRCQTVYR
jgi:acyl-CoA reductase-like NAD-dependent aldehyde dehydrogenase